MNPQPPRPGFPGTGPAARPVFPVVIVSDDDDLAPRDVRAEARRAIEAVVIAATEPVPVRTLAELVECSVDVVAADLRGARGPSTSDDGRGFVLAEVAGGYRYQTHPDLAPYVEQFVLEGQHVRLSGPRSRRWRSSPTSSRSPAGRSRPSAASSVESTLATLVQRGYVEEVGRDPGPGLAVLYGTTSAVPRAPRPRQPRRPAVARRLRARSRGRRGARARPAPRPGPPRLEPIDDGPTTPDDDPA